MHHKARARERSDSMERIRQLENTILIIYYVHTYIDSNLKSVKYAFDVLYNFMQF